MTINIVIFILIISITVISVYVNIVLYRKIIIHEDMYEKSEKDNDKLLNFIQQINNRFFQDYEKIKQIDSIGSFESDDEIGFVFSSIKDTVEESFVFLNEYLNSYSSNESKSEIEEEEKEEPQDSLFY